MDLYSPKDKLLLRACFVIKIGQIKSDFEHQKIDYSSAKSTIDYYENLINLIKNDDIDTLKRTLQTSVKMDDFLSANSKDISKKYLQIGTNLLISAGAYSPENISKIKKGLFIENEVQEISDNFYFCS